MTLCLGLNATAQNNDPCGCNSALWNGIYDYRIQRGDQAAAYDFENLIAHTSWEQFKQTFGSSGGFNYGLFGVHGGMDASQYKALQDQFKQEGHVSSSTKSSNQLFQQYGDINVLQAWSLCKQGCSQKGVDVWFQDAGDGEIVVVISYNPPPGDTARTVSIFLKNARPTYNQPTQFTIYSGTRDFQVTRQEKRPVSIYVQTRGFDYDFVIPVEKPEPKISPTPFSTPPPPTPTPTPTPSSTPPPTAPPPPPAPAKKQHTVVHHHKEKASPSASAAQ